MDQGCAILQFSCFVVIAQIMLAILLASATAAAIRDGRVTAVVTLSRGASNASPSLIR